MLQQMIVFVFLDSTLDVKQCLLIILLGEENPGIGVDEVGIVGLILDGKCRHALGTVEMQPALRQVVGIVVQRSRVVRVYL